jgi:hypothetical protein
MHVIFVVGPALIGYPDLRQRYPAVALLVIAVLYTLPMAVWMRVRGMDWRPIVEMSGAAIALAIVLVGLAGFGVISQSGLRGFALGFCGPACLVMIVAMLFRLDLYTGRAGHSMGHRRHAAHVA